ncbi:MAG: hypothetical protein MUO75_07275 [Actinobacteria bacterium]|nr:hypothetical protein [Actinomycetota bacterium]
MKAHLDYQTPKQYKDEACQQFGAEYTDMPRELLSIYRTALPVYHILELLGMAMGESPVPFHARTAKNMLAGVFLHQGPALLSRKRFSAAEIDTDIEQK